MTPNISDLMGDHHDACDAALEAAYLAVEDGAWTLARTRLAHFAQSLRWHMSVEEDLLFPSLEGALGVADGRIAEMRSEHEFIRSYLKVCDESFAAESRQAAINAVDAMRIALRQHNLGEERIFYPLCDEHLCDIRGPLVEHLHHEAGIHNPRARARISASGKDAAVVRSANPPFA
jgi:iron-sulfur cluster repair protein YtfE (RIC family)